MTDGSCKCWFKQYSNANCSGTATYTTGPAADIETINATTEQKCELLNGTCS